MIPLGDGFVKLIKMIIAPVIFCTVVTGIALIVGLFSNRSHNFWPVLSGFLVAVAYLLIGYFFILSLIHI